MDNVSNHDTIELAATIHKRPHFNELKFNVRLEFCKENVMGVKVYVDMWNNNAIKINDPHNEFDRHHG